jgi:hypothetical protein
MRIDASGNVGIGTSSPAGRLDVGSTSSSFTASLIRSSTTGISELRFADTTDNAGYIAYDHTGDYMRFATAATERMRIDSGGSVLVGTTSNNFASSNHKVVIASDSSVANPFGINNLQSGTGSSNCVFFGRNGTFTGGITNTDTTTAYNTSSDYRLKENIAPMTGALATVLTLKPVTYDWKSGGSSQGFIAHELQAVVPDAVTGEKDAVDADGNPVYQGIDTSFLVATLTAAIQELKAELDSVKAELNLLKGK